MTAINHSIISDIIKSRRLDDGDGYALALSRVIDQYNLRDETKLKTALCSVKTDFYFRNRGIKKAEFVELVIKHLIKKQQSAGPDAATDPVCKVLFVAANPLTTQPLQIDEETRQIQSKIRASEYRDAITFEVRLAARPDDILQAVNEIDPVILHFSGHGSPSEGIVMADNHGGHTTLSESAIDHLFSVLGSGVRLVLLNACYSELQAKMIVRHVDFVVGMTQPIGDAAAATFAGSFYRAIGFGRTIQNSYDQAIASLAMEHSGQEAIPVLKCQKGCDPNQISLI